MSGEALEEPRQPGSGREPVARGRGSSTGRSSPGTVGASDTSHRLQSPPTLQCPVRGSIHPSPLRMTDSQRQTILNHCREGLPYEACGLIFGKGRDSLSVRPMRNAARSTTFYTLDPAEQLEEMEAAREAGYDLVGIFHSHPVTRPYPSKTDVEFAGFWEDVWFLIASFRQEEPELCCYRIIGETVTETGIEIVEPETLTSSSDSQNHV